MANEQEQGERVGGLAGLGAGVITGAQIGTLLLPIPVVGTFVGALMGGVVGSAVGQRLGSAAYNNVNSFLDSLGTRPSSQDKGPDQPSGGASV